ncbi:MAG TPA: hypothetical protein VGS27_11905 [Candidatus Sulfotelmatobacter sp.]|nr:hypothetical protein [Candidatus Sulfotelmatobacter sp.]
MNSHQGDSEIPLEQVYSESPVSTDPNVHIKAVKGLIESGVTIVTIHTGQADQKRVIQFYSKEVLPKTKSEQNYWLAEFPPLEKVSGGSK